MERSLYFMILLEQEADIRFQKRLCSLKKHLRTRAIKFIPNSSGKGPGSIIIIEQRSNTVTWTLQSKLEKKGIKFESLFPIESSMFSFYDQKNRMPKKNSKAVSYSMSDNQNAENCFQIVFSPSPAIQGLLRQAGLGFQNSQKPDQHSHALHLNNSSDTLVIEEEIIGNPRDPERKNENSQNNIQIQQLFTDFKQKQIEFYRNVAVQILKKCNELTLQTFMLRQNENQMEEQIIQSLLVYLQSENLITLEGETCIITSKGLEYLVQPDIIKEKEGKQKVKVESIKIEEGPCRLNFQQEFNYHLSENCCNRLNRILQAQE